MINYYNLAPGAKEKYIYFYKIYLVYMFRGRQGGLNKLEISL